MTNLKGKTVAILTENGFEEVELTSPKKALEDAGATVKIVSPQKDKVRSWVHDHWNMELPVDVNIEDARADDFDALVLPGGVMNPDKLRTSEKAVEFVREFFDAGKPVAAICHGPQLLIEAEVLDGRDLTSYPSVRKDIENAGGTWQDRAVVVDQGLVTSRSPEDLPAFNKKMLEEIGEGPHAPMETGGKRNRNASLAPDEFVKTPPPAH